MTHVLRAKTFDTLILENDSVNEYLFPEIFNNTTPDLVMVQSCGRRKDDSEPDVGRNSIRTSKAWITPSQSAMTACQIDATTSGNAHSEDNYGYWNLPAPVSDDGDGVRTSRGWVEIIQNGVRITNDSQYTTENHQLTISIMGGTDMEAVQIIKVDQNSQDIDVNTFGNRIYPTAAGTNLIVTESFGGPADTENKGFLDGSGIAHAWRTENPTSLTADSVNRSYIFRNNINSTPSGFDGRGEDGWYFDDVAQGLTRSTSAVLFMSRDSSHNKIPDIAGIDNGQVGTLNCTWGISSIQYNNSNYGPQYLDPAKPEGQEFVQIDFKNSSVPVSTYGPAQCGGYLVFIKFKSTGSGRSGDNVGVWCTAAGNPYGYSNRWTGTTQAGDPTASRTGSTRGWPNEKTPYTIGGADDTINHWPLYSNGGAATARMTTKPITCGFFSQFLVEDSSGMAASRFQYDARRGIDTSSNTGTNPTTGAGVGYAMKPRIISNVGGGGYPETYKFVNPQFYAAQGSTNNPNSDWSTGGDNLDGKIESVDDYIYQYTQSTNSNTSAGSALVSLNKLYSNVSGGKAWVTWDGSGAITSVVVDASATSTDYWLGAELYVTVSTATTTPSGESNSISRANVWADKVDGVSMAANGGRVKYDREMGWAADGGLILTQDQTNVYDGYGLYAFEMHLILSASDGSGTGDDQGGNGGGIGNGIYYGSTPVTELYHGSVPVPRVAYNNTEII